MGSHILIYDFYLYPSLSLPHGQSLQRLHSSTFENKLKAMPLVAPLELFHHDQGIVIP